MNNAGIVSNDPSFTVNVDVVKRVFAVNYFGPLNMIQQTVPHMPRGGRIVNIGTIASKIGWEADPTYAASKAAMDHLTLSVSKEVSVLHSENLLYKWPHRQPTKSDMKTAWDQAWPHHKCRRPWRHSYR